MLKGLDFTLPRDPEGREGPVFPMLRQQLPRGRPCCREMGKGWKRPSFHAALPRPDPSLCPRCNPRPAFKGRALPRRSPGESEPGKDGSEDSLPETSGLLKSLSTTAGGTRLMLGAVAERPAVGLDVQGWGEGWAMRRQPGALRVPLPRPPRGLSVLANSAQGLGG